jgi:hypothetical protein
MMVMSMASMVVERGRLGNAAAPNGTLRPKDLWDEPKAPPAPIFKEAMRTMWRNLPLRTHAEDCRPDETTARSGYGPHRPLRGTALP